MPMHHRNIEFPQGDFVAHKKKKAAKTWDSLERPHFKKEFSIISKITITNKKQKVNMKVGGGV